MSYHTSSLSLLTFAGAKLINYSEKQNDFMTAQQRQVSILQQTLINQQIITLKSKLYKHLNQQICFDLLQTQVQKMARNCEKAQGMLNRWWTMKRALVNKQQDQRPRGLRHIREINDLYECEKWRKQVTTNIIEKVEEIQNRARPENQIRTINDEINRLLRELYHWQIRIKQLGGNDYRSIKNAKMYDSQGHQIPGFGGYRYFGAAKDLPGVKDVFRREVPTAPLKSKQQLRKMVDEEYFGDQQTLDQQLLKQQKLEEEAKRQEDLIRWIEQNKKKIHQYFKGREPQIDQLMENIDNIQDFEVEVQEQMIEQKVESNKITEN